MTGVLPRIAVPEPTSTDEAYNQRSLPQYVRAVEAAGGTAVPILLHSSSEVQAKLLATCAGVLLPGSPADLDPERYGQEPVTETAAKDGPRESADNLLLEGAFIQGKPVLGICFGLQSLNVWRRGTLIQDLPRAHAPASPQIDHAPGSNVLDAHEVRVEPASRLARLIPADAFTKGTGGLIVNSSHHQAIDRPGQHLKIVAVSPVDGVIEALEGDDTEQFIVAVQWHPERSYEQSSASRALFGAFLEAARVWSSLQSAVGTRTA